MKNTAPYQKYYIIFILIGLAVLFGHFLYMQRFGFYEDDYWATVPFLGKPLSSIFVVLLDAFRQWPQGRPLNHSLPQIQAILGMHLGGITGIYAIGYLGLAVNCCLCFAVLQRFFPPRAAIVGTLAYVFFPADTTKEFLVHTAHVQGGMFFFFLGAFLWIKGGKWRLSSYGVATLSLLSYETTFLPFLTLPLFTGSSFRGTWRHLLRHLAGCSAFVAVYAVIRITRGETRTVDAIHAPLTTLAHIFSSLYLGPWTSARRCLVAPLEGLERFDPVAIICAVLLAALVLLAFSHQPPLHESSDNLKQGRPPSVYFLACAAITWSACYALTLTNYPPTQTLGRMTSTHTAAAWGASLFAAAGTCWLTDPLRPGFLRKLSSVIGIIYLSGSLSFCQWVQKEYVRSWELQKNFWRQVVQLCPEVGPGWSIIVNGSPSPTSPIMQTNSWADILTCRALYSAPVNFAHLGYLGDAIKLQRRDGALWWDPEYWSGSMVKLDGHKLALLHSSGGILSRVSEIQTSAGIVRASPPAGTAERPLTSPLAKAMFSCPPEH